MVSRPKKSIPPRRMQNHHGGMILLDGCLYGANGGNEGGFLVCLDFQTGKVLWDERPQGLPKGSLALADGRLYYRTEDGTMLLIEPNPKRIVERGRFEQPDRTRVAGLDAPGHRQRQTVRARPGFAALLRRQGEVTKRFVIHAIFSTVGSVFSFATRAPGTRPARLLADTL